MTNINWFDNQHNWIGFFVINALDHTKMPEDKFDAENLDVKLTVNGIEFDFISVVEHMGKEFDNTVKREAMKLMKENLKNDLFGRIDEIAFKAGLLESELEDKYQELIQMPLT
jgi:hypothetical protein